MIFFLNFISSPGLCLKRREMRPKTLLLRCPCTHTPTGTHITPRHTHHARTHTCTLTLCPPWERAPPYTAHCVDTSICTVDTFVSTQQSPVQTLSGHSPVDPLCTPHMPCPICCTQPSCLLSHCMYVCLHTHLSTQFMASSTCTQSQDQGLSHRRHQGDPVVSQGGRSQEGGGLSCLEL